MTSALGASLATSRWRLTAAIALGAAVVAADLLLAARAIAVDYAVAERLRIGLIAAAVVGLLLIARGDRAALGLVLRPAQPLRWWLRATALAGLAVAAFIVIATLLLFLFGVNLVPARPLFADIDATAFLWTALVTAPLIEEPIYRLALCAPLASAVGRWPTIIASGSLFGMLHFFYGNPGPDNFVAGYVLGWAYLTSRSLAVPIALHALGNLAVWTVHVLHYAWYVL